MDTTKKTRSDRKEGGEAMNLHMFRKALGIVAVLLTSGCAQDLGTIDRVQDRLVRKSDLLWNADGTPAEWYFRQTVIDAPYASAYSFVGDQGVMERGVFEVQEKQLYFYRTYTFTEGEYDNNPRKDVDTMMKCSPAKQYCDKEGKPLDPAVTCDCDGNYLRDGKPVWMDKNGLVAAFPIEAHVDVIWEYNANTGEKTNVKSENTSDRLWWERDYMRVDWSGQIDNFQFTLGWYTKDVAFTQYRGESGAPEDEPRILASEGYMDFVHEYVMAGQTAYDDEYGTIPLCWYYPWYSGGIYECISEKLKARAAFLKVDIKREAEYKAGAYNDIDFERFGYFRSERMTWDHNYGTAYSQIIRHINRFDIFQYDTDGKTVKGLRPIVYYLNEGYPDNLVPEAVKLGKEWSRAFNAAVKAKTGKDPSAFGVDDMFVVCENSLRAAAARTGDKARTTAPCVYEMPKGCGKSCSDDSDCGSRLHCIKVDGITLPDEAGTTLKGGHRCVLADGTCEEPKRDGDLRYNFLTAVMAPTNNGLYGYGPSSADPLSGRIVNAVANMYTAAMREGANNALRRLDLLAGVRSFRELADAEYISRAGKVERLNQTYWRNGYTTEEAQAIASSLVAEDVRADIDANGLEEADLNYAQARLNLLKHNPEIETMFITPDVQALFKDPNAGAKNAKLTPEKIEKYALRNWANGRGFAQKLSYYKEMSRRSMDLADFYDGALIHLSREFKPQYDKAVCAALAARTDIGMDLGQYAEDCTVEKIVEAMRTQVALFNMSSPYGFQQNYILSPLDVDTINPKLAAIQAVIKDTLNGLREGFIEDLQKRIFWGVAIHEVGHTVGLRHNFEASTDAFNFPKEYWGLKVKKDGAKYKAVGLFGDTPEQDAAGMREYQYSSVMDYYSKFNLPWLGIGLYDIAAIKYGYAETVEVFKTEPELKAYEKYFDIDPTQGQPGNFPTVKTRGEGLGKLMRFVHPTEYPNFWGDIDKMYDREDVPKSQFFGSAAKCKGKAEGDACEKDKICMPMFGGMQCVLPRTLVPYRFGADEEIFGLPTVGYFDEGVDPFEIVENARERYEEGWVFAGYWHQDTTWNPQNYDSFVRFAFTQFALQFRWWAMDYATYNHNDYWKKRFGKRWEEDINGGLSGAMAARVAFNTLVGAFGRPSPDVYGFNLKTQRYEPVDSVNINNYYNQVSFLEEDGARPIYAQWDYDGYYLPVAVSAGSIYDRIAAFEYLSAPSFDNLLGVDTTDARRFNVNFSTVFRNEIREMFGGIMANNATKYGWCVLMHQDKPVGFAQRDFVRRNGVDLGCEQRFCGKVVNGKVRDAEQADLTDLSNPKCPEGKTLLSGTHLEPEPLYIFPTTQFRIPMLAAYYGMSWLVNNYDKSFMDATRIWLEGNKYAIEPPKDALVATCEDRFSGRIYHAYAMPDGGYYPAYDLVQHCNLIFKCYDETQNKTLSDDELAKCKGITQVDKVSELTMDDLRSGLLFSEVQFLLGKLELIRSMHTTFDYDWIQ